MSVDKMKLAVAKKKIMVVFNKWHSSWCSEKLAEVVKIDNATFQHAEDLLLEEFDHDELVTLIINEQLRRGDYSSATKASRDNIIALRERLDQIRLDMTAEVELRDAKAKEILFNNEKQKTRVATYYAYQALEAIVLCDFDMVKIEETLLELEEELYAIKGDEVVTSHPCTSDELHLGI